MICIDDNPSMAASFPGHFQRCSTPRCPLSLAGTEGGFQSGIAGWDGVWGRNLEDALC